MAETILNFNEFEEMLEKLENGTEKEKVEARLYIMGRILYYEGD